eukprot:TRINITY_DN10983_c0_g1_i1.p2 TRINITY_DN10983_c0_g1~~TRINITY_DN10983_c0_g1_i1.p2  ORF type:complete len:127 (-),score=6.36 TRINITY_DN10983_c0_g1_i1:137-517(-)
MCIRDRRRVHGGDPQKRAHFHYDWWRQKETRPKKGLYQLLEFRMTLTGLFAWTAKSKPSTTEGNDPSIMVCIIKDPFKTIDCRAQYSNRGLLRETTLNSRSKDNRFKCRSLSLVESTTNQREPELL